MSEVEEKEGLYRALLGVVLVYFAGRLVYFAFAIDPTVPPDELTHYGRVLLYSRSLLIPADTPESYELGLIAHQPYLYYFLLGKLLHFNFFLSSNLVFLRLVNGVLAILGVVYAYRWVRLCFGDRRLALLAAVVMTNTAMFSFLSASVSYDNLAFFLCTAALFYLSQFLVERRKDALGLFLASILAATLTETKTWPVALVYCVGLGLYELRRRGESWSEWRTWLTGRSAALLVPAVILLAVLNAGLYGSNLLRFGRPVPEPLQVLRLDEALQYRIFARSYVVEQYRKGDMDFDEALAFAQRIRPEIDRIGAIALLMGTREMRERREQMNPLSYGLRWCFLMFERMVGIMAHQNLLKGLGMLLPYLLVGGIAGLRLAIRFRPGGANAPENLALLAIAVQSLVLMTFVNYPVYASTGLMDAGLQGRYLFPVLAPICGLGLYHLLAAFPSAARPYLSAGVAALFVYGDLFYFLGHATSDWFGVP